MYGNPTDLSRGGHNIMRQISLKVAALTAGAVLVLAAQAHAVALHVGSAQGAGGFTRQREHHAGIGRRRRCGDAERRSRSRTGARIKAKDNGTPDCTVNADIMKNCLTCLPAARLRRATPARRTRAHHLAGEHDGDSRRLDAVHLQRADRRRYPEGTLAARLHDPGASDPDGNALTPPARTARSPSAAKCRPRRRRRVPRRPRRRLRLWKRR